MNSTTVQLDDQHELRHFLSIEGLRREHLERILDLAESFVSVSTRAIKKVPVLRGKTIVNLFFEPSTRTRTTFELAAKRLSADVLNISGAESAVLKGESTLDMLRNLQAMHCDMFVIRHSVSGAVHFIASQLAPGVAVINAGDGCHSHPTQAVLDLLTIRRNKRDFSTLKVAIVGDIAHSRVARSEILALRLMGVPDIRVVGPRTLIPIGIESMGVTVHDQLHEGIRDADVIMVLRLQRERMCGFLLPNEQEYFRLYGLTEATLAHAAQDVIVMHPGPINRGIEMESEVVDGKAAKILEQVSYGIASRMSIMALVMGVAPT